MHPAKETGKPEGKVQQAVDHPQPQLSNQLIDRGRSAAGLDYMVLPAYAGSSLRKRVRQSDVPLPLAFSLIEQVFDALTGCHRAGVVHRDVKPENLVLLRQSGQLKLIDFGIARFLDPRREEESKIFRTAKGLASGSPSYVAPETLTDEGFDQRTDLYSAGVLSFELLTGVTPFGPGSMTELARKHLLEPAPTLGQVRSDLSWPPELERLVADLLAKQPNDRPRSAEAVLQVLRGGLAQRCLERSQPSSQPQIPLTQSFSGFMPDPRPQAPPKQPPQTR